jgi:hypothetical protein
VWKKKDGTGSKDGGWRTEEREEERGRNSEGAGGQRGRSVREGQGGSPERRQEEESNGEGARAPEKGRQRERQVYVVVRLRPPHQVLARPAPPRFRIPLLFLHLHRVVLRLEPLGKVLERGAGGGLELCGQQGSFCVSGVGNGWNARSRRRYAIDLGAIDSGWEVGRMEDGMVYGVWAEDSVWAKDGVRAVDWP